jgi:hypothetical protein
MECKILKHFQILRIFFSTISKKTWKKFMPNITLPFQVWNIQITFLSVFYLLFELSIFKEITNDGKFINPSHYLRGLKSREQTKRSCVCLLLKFFLILFLIVDVNFCKIK